MDIAIPEDYMMTEQLMGNLPSLHQEESGDE
ncbi:hypothetical protein C5S35_00090 [Candidatus Methanophagaceae archaeon]|nr:hypothetical protein C5S35_00090 [Methanophagales archaeon]